jgi:hypothetical protein
MGKEAVSWYKVEFSPEEIVQGNASKLQEVFQNLFIGLGGPKDMGMFTELGSNVYFFSTGTATIGAILKRGYAAVECSPPKRSGLSMLVVNFSGRHVPFGPED